VSTGSGEEYSKISLRQNRQDLVHKKGKIARRGEPRGGIIEEEIMARRRKRTQNGGGSGRRRFSHRQDQKKKVDSARSIKKAEENVLKKRGSTIAENDEQKNPVKREESRPA